MEMQERVVAAFEAAYGRRPGVVTRAPGRLEILGNHTDYNEGTVLSVAVDRATWVSAGLSGTRECRLLDAVSGSRRGFRVDAVEARPRPGDWVNYVKGLVVELGRRGVAVPGFDLVLGSTVPLSAGMSSSAALEMSVLLALLRLAGRDLDWREMARVGQACENDYVGARTGLLDQFSSLRGQAGHLVYSDFRSLEVAAVPLPAGTALVVANSMVRHTLTGEYNERREACEEAVRLLQADGMAVRALRDVTPACLEAAAGRLPPRVYRRARHVVGEIARVEAGVAALREGRLRDFGRLLNESHESSIANFENSCPELDALVALGRSLPGALGARLSGGGFGGITVHLVEADQAAAYAEALQRQYRTRTGQAAETMVCTAAEGAGVMAS
ncbi:MAG: galactokinase [Lentisphaerae bacterium]|nr:galactokinase [Lentisphaerota bacterium]